MISTRKRSASRLDLGDLEATLSAARTLTKSSEVRAVIEAMCEAGHEDEASTLVTECKTDPERELLAWFAIRTGRMGLASAVAEAVRDDQTRRRLTAVLDAAAATLD